jgi:hypothetical protein
VIPAGGRRLFEAYVLQEWLPHHQLEPGVRSEYARQIHKHLLPFFGPMKMRDIMPEQVRRLRDGHPHRLIRRDAIADVTHQYQRATAGDRTPGIPSLTRAERRRSPGAVPD